MARPVARRRTWELTVLMQRYTNVQRSRTSLSLVQLARWLLLAKIAGKERPCVLVVEAQPEALSAGQDAALERAAAVAQHEGKEQNVVG